MLTKRAMFNGIPDKTTEKYRGQPFEVMRMLIAEEWEEVDGGTGEITPGAHIRFEDGFETDAFPEEIWEEHWWK